MEQGPRQPVVDDVPRGTVISGDMNKVEASELCGLCPGESLATGRHWATLLSRFAESVFRWSGRISLVSAGDRHSLVNKHILPAVALRPLILSVPHGSVWDVGSGAGFPGVALKILWPRLDLVLLESQKKRANFLKTLARESGFGNFLVVEGRPEDVCGQAAYKEKFDVVTFKGVGNPKLCLALGGPFLKQGGILVVKQEPEQFFANSSREFRLKNEISTSGLQGLESKLMVFLKCFT